jgi:phage terminase small subunit
MGPKPQAAGYSAKTAAFQASRLLKNVLDISADRVLQQLAKIAFFDSRKLFNQDGSLKNVNELSARAGPSRRESPWITHSW